MSAATAERRLLRLRRGRVSAERPERAAGEDKTFRAYDPDQA
jgi:hypothetical protein